MSAFGGYIKRYWKLAAVLLSLATAGGFGVRFSGITASPVNYSQAEYIAARESYCPGEAVEWQHTLEWHDYVGPLNQRQVLRQYHGAILPEASRELLLIIDENTPTNLTVTRRFTLTSSLVLPPGDYEILVFTYSPLESRAGDGYSVPFEIADCGQSADGEDENGSEEPEPVNTGNPTTASQTATVGATREPPLTPTPSTTAVSRPQVSPSPSPTPVPAASPPAPTVAHPPTCSYFDRGARKPDPPIAYSITQGNSQNVRNAPSWGVVIDSIPRVDATTKQVIQYPIYWRLGDWLALDSECSRWVAAWLGNVTIQP